jgi:hypothetical protein
MPTPEVGNCLTSATRGPRRQARERRGITAALEHDLRSAAVPITIRSVVLAAVMLLSVACASAPPPAPVAATTTTARPGCNDALPEVVTAITSTLIGDAKKIGKAFMLEENNRQYVGANVYDAAGKELSTGDVWIIEKGKVYSLSTGARTHSNAADGRELPDKPSAGVGLGRFVAGCAHPT